MSSTTALSVTVANTKSVGLQVRLRQIAPIPLNVDFHCRAGELIALVGPSGSGKSTILRCIAGLATPRSGTILFNGRAWLDTASGVTLRPQQRPVGLVFQHYALFPHLSALQNIAVVLADRPKVERERRARGLLELVRLDGLESRRPQALSGGQQQRVALARSLAREPAALLLDEPFSAVDMVTREKLKRELARLRQKLEIPIVLVTHDLDEARMLADRICVLHRGQILQTGTPTQVMSQPVSSLVARLVGLTNVFQGEVIDHDADKQLTHLRWLSYALECREQSHGRPGETVDWIVPSEHIILHRRDRPSRGEHENPIAGVIDDFVVLGGDASITMLVDGRADTPLTFMLSSHVARRNRLGVGEQVGVSLLAEGIHVMPATDQTQDGRPGP
ncbi:MAG: ABC transporter ATP-binding protein [Gammaproteobacteria bacterium]|nr:ABC transporter ATP-binding protein [Gammaproteobacteria bacterium]